MLCGRNAQLMPTLFLKRTKIWQRKNGKFVDFSDPTQDRRRPGKKRIRTSTNHLYCYKLELLTYIFVTDSIGLSKAASEKTRVLHKIATQSHSRSFTLQSVTGRQEVAYRHIILLALNLKFPKK